jgi:hypothetical protein
VVVEVYKRPRKRTLAPLGAVIVTILLTAGILYLILTWSEGTPGFGPIRAYYESAAGGSMPKSVVNRLEFGGCHDTGVTLHDGSKVYECKLSDGPRPFHACFVFDIDGAGVIDGGPGLLCGAVVYNRATDSFVQR